LLASGGLGGHVDGWDHLEQFGLPFVAFAVRGERPNRVALDWVEAIRLGTRALLDRGCRRLALWHRNPFCAGEKSAAFMQALAYAGARTRPEWNVIAPSHGPVDSVAEELFRGKWSAWDEKPDGVVCGDDIMTQGLVRAAAREGVRLPHDLRIASHANKGYECWGRAPVTRVEFDMAQVAVVMIDRLDALLDGKCPEPDLLLIKPYLTSASRRS
jgi:DNA-binding LacI/PurR family transcriptional regulator